MNDNVLLRSAERIVGDLCDGPAIRAAASGVWPEKAHSALVESGLLLALVPESRGGFGLPASEGAALLSLAGYHALPLPWADTMLALRLLALADIPAMPGVTTLAPPRHTSVRGQRREGRWSIAGRASRVPWGRRADTVVLVADGEGGPLLVSLRPDDFRISESVNLAGEPRDELIIDAVLAPDRAGELTAAEASGIILAGAALRTIMIAGAANRVLDLSISYSGERTQFGRPIAAFQAVQQNLAMLAGQAAVCQACAGMAANALFDAGGALAIAMAKARAGEAGAEAAHLAHQIHGAIGYTQEYDLQLCSRRIWAWREEYGNEGQWYDSVGDAVLAGEEGPWAMITRASGAF